MRLKNFPIYLEKIKKWCKASGVHIRSKKSLPCEGVYYPHNKTIAYSEELSESEIISCLLHEIGHLLDDYTNKDKYSHIHFVQGIDNIQAVKRLTKRQKKKVVDTEVSAWKNAEALAKILKIPLGKWYYKDKKEALKSYTDIEVRPYK